MQSLGAVGLAALCLSTASADIALLGDGSRVTGQLTAAEGRLRFLQSDKALASRPQLIQFNPTVSERLDRFQQRVWFDDGQHFSGSLVKVGPKVLVLQVATSVVRSIPRDEVRAISRASAHRPVLGDDFEQASKYWQLAGGAAQQGAGGERGLGPEARPAGPIRHARAARPRRGRTRRSELPGRRHAARRRLAAARHLWRRRGGENRDRTARRYCRIQRRGGARRGRLAPPVAALSRRLSARRPRAPGRLVEPRSSALSGALQAEFGLHRRGRGGRRRGIRR